MKKEKKLNKIIANFFYLFIQIELKYRSRIDICSSIDNHHPQINELFYSYS